MEISIKGLDKAALLVALHANSKQQGMGFLQPSGGISYEQAQALLEEGTYFDYLSGRVMKIDLSGDVLDTRLYDRDLGDGAGERVVQSLRSVDA